MRKPSTADALLAALNAIEGRTVGDDSGEFKTRSGWEKEWQKSRPYTTTLIRRAVDAGLMEESEQYRMVGRVPRKTPVYRMKPCPPPAKLRGGSPVSTVTRRSAQTR